MSHYTDEENTEKKLIRLEQTVNTLTTNISSLVDTLQQLVINSNGRIGPSNQQSPGIAPSHSGQNYATSPASNPNPWAAIKFNQLNSYGWKYIDLDSTYRNRTLYPLASDFVVPYTNNSPGSNTYNSLEPVSNGLPYETVTVESIIYDTATGGQIVVSNPTYNLNNYFINSYVSSITGEISQVIKYMVSPSGNFMTYNSQLSPVVGESITLSRSRPVIPLLLADSAQSTSSYITFPPYPFVTFSSDPNTYKGMFMLISDIFFTNVINPGAVRVITNYDPALNRFYVNPPFSFNPFGGVYFGQISQFSYDSVQPLYYAGTRMFQPVCFDVQLLGLAIPIQILASAYGGTVDNYPYLSVYFSNDNDNNSDLIYTNNPNSLKSTFKIYMSRLQTTEQSFIVLLNQSIAAEQSMKLLLNNSFRITISTPDGEPLKFQKSDNPPPFPPDPLLQISALMAVRRSF